MVQRFEPDSSILDVPLGTGRFIPFYQENRHSVIGIDISTDMMHEACKKFNISSFMAGDVEALPMKDHSVDYIVCIRLFNWLPKHVYRNVIDEFSRVARKGIIVGFRCKESMPIMDFFKKGLKEYIPTPRRVMDWAKTAVLFGRRMAGITKRKIYKIILPNKKIPPIPFTGSSLYQKQKMTALLENKKWSLEMETPIDVTFNAKKKRIQPYSIYFFKINHSL